MHGMKHGLVAWYSSLVPRPKDSLTAWSTSFCTCISFPEDLHGNQYTYMHIHCVVQFPVVRCSMCQYLSLRWPASLCMRCAFWHGLCMVYAYVNSSPKSKTAAYIHSHGYKVYIHVVLYRIKFNVLHICALAWPHEPNNFFRDYGKQYTC